MNPGKPTGDATTGLRVHGWHWPVHDTGLTPQQAADALGRITPEHVARAKAELAAAAETLDGPSRASMPPLTASQPSGGLREPHAAERHTGTQWAATPSAVTRWWHWAVVAGAVVAVVGAVGWWVG